MANDSHTVVDHSPHHSKDKGLSHTNPTGIVRWYMAKYYRKRMANDSGTMVEHLPHYLKVKQ
jgi:hypothetical protein